MALTPIQYIGAGNLAVPAATFASTPTVGNSVLVFCEIIETSPETITAVGDNQGGSNSYSLIAYARSPSGNSDLELWWCKSLVTASGTFTVTATQSGIVSAGNRACTIIECPPLTLDQVGTNFLSVVNTTLTVTASGANTQANELVVAGLGGASFSGGVYGPPTTGYTDAYHNTSGNAFLTGFKVVSSVETSAATGTWGTSASGVGVVATFYAASSGGQIVLPGRQIFILP